MEKLTKVCSKCGKEKVLTEFCRNKIAKDGLNYYCRVCADIYRHTRKGKVAHKRARQKFKKTAKGKKLNRALQLRYKYGITPEDYDRRFTEQNGVCALCGRSEQRQYSDGIISRLCVDHNHKTNEVRGLLCATCNTQLGYYEKMRDTGMLVILEQYSIKGFIKEA